ncbi:DNA polymerase delta small subunit Cdc1 [Coemansia sp. RSA 2399]|nr:DNA polymerase delta small subunit Cdc1 [Coemansia sp. RSA 2399]KAJ1900067.1 DNA polymerase delta small subunit Cdc1 [Coemansia sp. IMI 209127]
MTEEPPHAIIQRTEQTMLDSTQPPGENGLQSFRIHGHRVYTQQFDQLYYKRLDDLKPVVLEQAKRRWTSSDNKTKWTPKVLNVEGPSLTYIIGTIFIDSSAKPSTLDEVEKTHWIADPTVEGKYRDGSEVVYLEDESGRIRLVGKELTKATIASGIVAAVLGAETPTGEFDVAEICFAGMPPPLSSDDNPVPSIAEDRYVAFVSGFNATIEQPVTLEMQLLAEYIVGNLGTADTQRACAQIVQVVVAGGLLSLPEPPLGHTEDPRANDRHAAAKLVAQIDEYLADIAASVPLTVMPGKGDPADVSIPQQPINRYMFGQCRQFSGFASTTNPAWLNVDGVEILGTAGQNVDDLRHYSVNGESACLLAAESLRWRHIAPTAPDTLWCYPFTDKDPFILEHSPHVYFVGNQPVADFAWAGDGDAAARSSARTRVLTVPVFKDSHQIVLLNLRSMECSTVSIGHTMAHEQ